MCHCKVTSPADVSYSENHPCLHITSGLSQEQPQKMRIATLQFGPRLGDLKYNIDRADALLASTNLENVDLLVGPELALTGKIFDGGSLCLSLPTFVHEQAHQSRLQFPIIAGNKRLPRTNVWWSNSLVGIWNSSEIWAGGQHWLSRDNDGPLCCP